MNEKLSRPQFNQMDTTEKQALMESLAARYDMTFLGLHTFDRWGQSCTTGIFKKDGREFVFVPGDTVTLGWEQFAEGLNQERREELDYLFQEWEMEPQNPEEMIRESMAPVRQAVIGPMLVGRELEELCWEPVKMDDPRLTAHPDWLKEFRDFAWSDSSSLTLHQSARIERTEDGFHTWIYHCTDYDALLAGLEKQGLSLPTADEWAYLCGGGCRTLFPWGDGLDYSMRLRWFEDMDEDENRPYDIEMDEIPAIQELLKDAKSFRCYGFDCYERYWELTDKEYLAQLETKREEITHEILERCRTKRKNLYITGPVALNVAQKFSVHRLCDKEGKHNLANRFVGELMEQLVQDGLLVTTKTRNGPGVRTATDAEISSPLPGQQQMTL